MQVARCRPALCPGLRPSSSRTHTQGTRGTGAPHFPASAPPALGHSRRRAEHSGTARTSHTLYSCSVLSSSGLDRSWSAPSMVPAALLVAVPCRAARWLGWARARPPGPEPSRAEPSLRFALRQTGARRARELQVLLWGPASGTGSERRFGSGRRVGRVLGAGSCVAGLRGAACCRRFCASGGACISPLSELLKPGKADVSVRGHRRPRQPRRKCT